MTGPTGAHATRRQREEAHSRGRNDLAVAPLLFALPLAGLITAAPATGWSWIFAAALAVGIMVAIGTGVRASGADSLQTRALAWWLQAAALAFILVLREALVSDWEPALSGAALWELLQSLGFSIGNGVWNMAWYTELPFPASDSKTTVMVLAAGVFTLLNDFVLRVVRLPALAVAWMLLPALMPMAIRIDMQPLLLVPVSLLLVVALLTCGQRIRGARSKKTGLAIVAASAAIVLALPLALPDPRGLSWRMPDLFTRSGWFAPASPVLSEDIDLSSHLQRPDPVEIMRYRTSDGNPSYFRLTALSDTSQGGFAESPYDEDQISSYLTGTEPTPLTTGQYEFSAESTGFVTQYLPVPTNVTFIPGQQERVAGQDRMTGGVLLQPDAAELPLGYEWNGTATRTIPDPMVFEEISREPRGWGLFETLPSEVQELRPLAEEIVGDAGSDVAMMDRLVEWFRADDWQYSEEIPFAGFGSDQEGQWQALHAFLEERVGYCVHYASALAALALSLEIPARVAIGFLPGERQDDGSFSVTTNDMHAWTEVQLEGLGWVSYDVTPAILAGESRASDPGGNPFGPDGTAPTPRPTETESPSPTPSEDASPTPTDSEEPSPSDSDDPNDPNDELRPSDEATPNGEESETQEEEESTPVPTAALVLLGIVLVVVLPVLIRGARRTLRRRAGVVGAWNEVLDTAIDVGVRIPPGATAAQVVLLLREHLPDDLAKTLARMRLDAESASFGRRDAVLQPYDVAAVRAISRELWRQSTPFGGIVRRWLPPSLIPKRLRSMQT
ncbi:transglutaminase domain-containing protein [uncultured Agrococcus sp.]|uniref:transglutaminase family protein n=1 Tax=uncultured Agrococcus sp. TaxID=382258 RepID=UPI0025DCA74B|nr:transglutaminase domain-containing protein [uncultured Agrococcus sp.]